MEPLELTMRHEINGGSALFLLEGTVDLTPLQYVVTDQIASNHRLRYFHVNAAPRLFLEQISQDFWGFFLYRCSKFVLKMW